MSSFGIDFASAAKPAHFDIFGEDASYTPSGGEASDVTVVVGREEVRQDEQGGKKTIRERSFALKTSEVTLATLVDAVITYPRSGGRAYSVSRIEATNEACGIVEVRAVHVAEATRERPGLRGGPSW